ncbi:MAG: hypothetical protein WC554_15225 [Clostridia bacterium]
MKKKEYVVRNKEGHLKRMLNTDPRFNVEYFPKLDKILVKDVSGNTLWVSKDDERYIRGELINRYTGEIFVKYDGKIFKCMPNDPNVLNKTYETVKGNKHKYRHTKTGEILYLFDCDDLVLSKIAMPILTEYRTVKDETGKSFNVFKDDERLKTGELFAATAKHICNCKKHGNSIIVRYKPIKNVAIPEKYKIYCQQCIDEYLSDNFIPSENDILECKKFLNEFYFVSSNQQVEKYFKYYLPQFFKIINNVVAPRFSDKIFMFKNEFKEPPYCKNNNCKNRVNFLKGSVGFTDFCDIHKNSYSSSNGEKEIVDYIKLFYIKDILTNYRKLGKEIDIFLPKLNLGIEFNGMYWHSEEYKNKTHHLNKWKLCQKNNIKLITVWEDDWRDKQEIIKSIIKNQLSLTENKIYARKCVIKNVENKDKLKFLIDNHIQGNCQSSINLGLYYNNELVSLMTFGKKRMIMKSKSQENEYELLRFCNKLNTSVIGGASKLFSYFIEQYKPEIIVSYANLDISNGNLYEILGFLKQQTININYWWVKNGKRYHRSNFMKHKLVKEGADPNKTEKEIMLERKYVKLWGTGNLKYIWQKEKD